ncbi:MarR family winged helix-turn-helix transcriptional regulator [Dactylosporangium sp. CA-092794]|uniref:MarR family winged helix-turn-helix transcriptional regulator n=1 Tax=Dactylosporangium sp. CA-092794 TaxID=3239929 RepID=UPI003D8E60AF
MDVTERAAEVARQLRATVGDLVRASRAEDRVPPATAAVLDLLDRHGAMTTADLAQRRHVRHQTMAATVTDLLGLGLVSSAPHPVDGRKKLLSLTARGRTALEEDRTHREQLLAAAVRRTLSAEQVRTLMNGLEVMALLTAELAAANPGREPGQFISGGW